MHGTWKTTGGTGGGLVGAGLIIFGAAYALHEATPAITAGGNVLIGLAKLLVITTGALVALAATAAIAWRIHRRHHPPRQPPWAGTYHTTVMPPARPSATLPPPPKALPAARGDLHLHFHGTTDPDQVAAAIRRTQEQP